MTLSLWRRTAACALIAFGLGCQGGFEDFSILYFGVEIRTDDSVVVRERTQLLIAVAPCSLPSDCLLLSSQVQWASANPARATVSAQGLVAAGPDTGGVYIKVTFEPFVDSQFIRVVDRGSPRWRVELSGTVSAAAASIGFADTATTVLVVHGGGSGSGRLRRLNLDGEQVWDVATCPAGNVAPSSAGVIVVSGPDCTRAHAPAGGIELWSSGGLGDAGSAQRRVNGWIVPHIVASAGVGQPEALVLSRISSTGAEVRRDTVFTAASIVPPSLTPAIAADGATLLAWVDGGVPVLGAVDSLGATQFLDTLASYPVGRSVSFGMNGTILIGTDDGLFAFDAGGVAAWSAGQAGDLVSTPAGDTEGNVYVLTAGGLVSYTSSGQQRWLADSLGSAAAGVSPAPVVLNNGELLAVCKGNRFLCWVARGTGVVLGSMDLGAQTLATPVVADDGTVIVVLGNVGQSGTGLPALVAVYGREGPLSVGWPAEGRTSSRSRSLLP